MQKLLIYILCVCPLLAEGQKPGITSPAQVDSLLSMPLLQQEPEKKHIYNVRLGIDLPISIVMTGLSRWGYYKLVDKPKVPEETILSLDYEEDVAAINRWGDKPQYSERAEKNSDIIFFGSFALGFIPALDPNINHDFGRILLMYWEALSITGAIYATTAGNYDKLRPQAYSEEAPMDVRTDDGSWNSFPGGHPSLTATTAFFTAKIFADYYPDRKGLKIALYSGAAGLTLTNAYFRWKAGKHFPTDLAVGMAYGTLVGILVPQLHKINKKERDLAINPYPGGLNLTYRID